MDMMDGILCVLLIFRLCLGHKEYLLQHFPGIPPISADVIIYMQALMG